MRQAGIIAAAALHALDHHVERLADDHRNAQILARGRRGDRRACGWSPGPVETNLVWIEVDPALGTAAEVAARLRDEGILVSALGPQVLRACTHLDVSREQAEHAADRLAALSAARPLTDRPPMDFPDRHSWDLDYAQARALQAELAGEVDTPPGPSWSTVAAADVSYNKHDPRLYAAVVVTDARTSEVIERVGVAAETRFPYIPGLLSFRELPPVLEAFRRLTTRPDVVICDGQGYAHPRRMGLACHLGLWLGLPTIGCAKSRFIGEFDEPGPDRGDRSPLVDRGRRSGRSEDEGEGEAGLRLGRSPVRPRKRGRRRPRRRDPVPDARGRAGWPTATSTS